MTKGIAVIGGMGQGSEIGNALIRAMIEKDYGVAVLTRNPAVVKDLAQSQSQVRCFEGDLNDEAHVEGTIAAIESELGPINLYVHNAASPIRGPIAQCGPQQFSEAWRATTLSAVTVIAAILPAMRQRGSGTLILTGATASIRGSAGFGPFASAKFALRGYAQALARELHPAGIHVAHVIVDGLIAGQRAQNVFGAEVAACIDADDLAARYLELAAQPVSCLTHELDLRPMSESF